MSDQRVQIGNRLTYTSESGTDYTGVVTGADMQLALRTATFESNGLREQVERLTRERDEARVAYDRALREISDHRRTA